MRIEWTIFQSLSSLFIQAPLELLSANCVDLWSQVGAASLHPVLQSVEVLFLNGLAGLNFDGVVIRSEIYDKIQLFFVIVVPVIELQFFPVVVVILMVGLNSGDDETRLEYRHSLTVLREIPQASLIADKFNSCPVLPARILMKFMKVSRSMILLIWRASFSM